MTKKDKAIDLYNKFRNANGTMSANGYAFWKEVKEELIKL